MEELNAIDWYRQRADNAVDASPRPTLHLHPVIGKPDDSVVGCHLIEA
jgi:predicted DNA-binding protein with PD1-like motif